MTGCTSGPKVIEFKQDKLEVEGQSAVERCVWPRLQEGIIDDKPVIYMEESELALQRSCQITEQANYEIANKNAESINEVVGAFNTLIDKAALHNNYAQFVIDSEHRLLEREESENTVLKTIILIGFIAAVL